ncbi:Na+/H+ antiporter subunit E [Halomonas hibernica]|uniref:Na+/H+ antiporter subunit E n=1 Tax=Halomonas hibernica TaxID=2591147 RepID=UPI0015531A67|nr:Na+/H+ antiporter subunit E [Halomonas hibernica]
MTLRWLPSPALSGALLIMWLLLNQSTVPAQVLLGSVLAIAAPLLARPLRPLAPAPLRKPLVLARLLFMSMIEIIRSCFNVSRIILFNAKGVKSQFVRVPLDLKDPYGLALLSCLINSTPGTVWVEQLPDSNDLALHVFDLHDEQWWIDTIKTRYEQPLIEIFEHE